MSAPEDHFAPEDCPGYVAEKNPAMPLHKLLMCASRYVASYAENTNNHPQARYGASNLLHQITEALNRKEGDCHAQHSQPEHGRNDTQPRPTEPQGGAVSCQKCGAETPEQCRLPSEVGCDHPQATQYVKAIAAELFHPSLKSGWLADDLRAAQERVASFGKPPQSIPVSEFVKSLEADGHADAIGAGREEVKKWMRHHISDSEMDELERTHKAFASNKSAGCFVHSYLVIGLIESLRASRADTEQARSSVESGVAAAAERAAKIADQCGKASRELGFLDAAAAQEFVAATIRKRCAHHD
jgi:hypothetical protein